MGAGARRWIAVGTVVAALLVGGATFPPAARRPARAAAPLVAPSPASDRVGVSAGLIFLDEASIERSLAQLRANGMHWLRETFYWGMLEPHPGEFNWRRSDALMTAAARNGIDVVAILAYSAPWAATLPHASDAQHYPPKHLSDYAAYAAAVTRRYGPGGSFWSSHRRLPNHPLGAVEIWNEPWWHGFWRPIANPIAYARMVRAAGASIRRVARRLPILVSADLDQIGRGGEPWIQQLLAVTPSIAPYVDVWSVHPYPDPKSLGPEQGDVSSSFQQVPVIERLVAAAGVNRPLWITEIGWSSANASEGVSESDQARFLSQALADALTTWQSFVGRTFIYTWDRDGRDPSDLQQHFGLLRPDGQPKPALAAVASATRG